MSSQAIGQRFSVSRGGCWQCGSDCRSRSDEVLTFSSVAYNGQVYAAWLCMRYTRSYVAAFFDIRALKQTALGGIVKPDDHGRL